MAANNINIVIGADIEKLQKGFQDAVKIAGASGDKINSKLEATAKAIEKDFERIASSANTKRAVTQLQNLALKVQALGPEFQDMADKIIRSAGGIKDSVGDVSAQIDYFASDTRRIDAVISAAQGVAGAFGIAEGAAALFGSENEELKKSMQKVQGAIALLNGLQAVQNVLQQESAFRTGLAAAAQEVLKIKTYAAASAMNAFKVALIGTGIGAAVLLVASLAGAFSDTSKMTKEASEAQKKYNDELTKLRQERAQLEQGEEKYARNELQRVSERLKNNQSELNAFQSYRSQYLKGLKSLGVEELSSDKAKAEEKLKQLVLTNEQLLVEKLKLEQKIQKIDAESSSKQLKKTEDAGKEATKKKLEVLSSQYELTLSNLKREESAALMTAKTEAEKAQIQFDYSQILLDEKAKYLKSQEALKSKEEKNAQGLKDALQIIANEQVVNENNFAKQMESIKQKEVDDNKKKVQDYEKSQNEKQAFIDQSSKKELDAINNFYQEKENVTTKEFQNGLISEKEYNNAILQLQLQRAKNTLQALKDAGVKNLAETEKQIIELEGKIKEGGLKLDDASKKFADTVNNSLQSIATSGFEGIGESLGQSILKGTSVMESAFQIVLESVANFIESYGKAMVAYGVAALAADAAIKSMNPAAAIIAGTALIATSVVVRNVQASGVQAFADGGIVSGPTLGLMGEYPGAASNPEVIAPLDRLKSLIGGGGDSGGYVAETRISGRDLAVVLKRYERDAQRG